MISRHRFLVELRSRDGRMLHQQGLEPDWEPAIEAAKLAGLRTCDAWFQPGRLEPVVEPVWASAAGPPVVRAFSIRLEQDGHSWSVDIPATPYVGDLAKALVAAKVSAGELVPGEVVHYLVAAYEQDLAPKPVSHARFEFTDGVPTCPAADRSVATQFDRSLACGEPDPADIGVVIPEDVLDEVCGLTLDAGERETGGVLIGHLCRDRGRGDVALEVTAQIAARHTEGDSTKVTFTSETWTDVRGAVALRRAGELIVGYWHSHPAFAWCAQCPVERQQVCQLSTGFLSSDDKALHRVMFPAAYTQSLVVTRSVNGLEARLFGWRRGVLEPRGFHLLPGEMPLPRARDAVRVVSVAARSVACKNSDTDTVSAMKGEVSHHAAPTAS